MKGLTDYIAERYTDENMSYAAAMSYLNYLYNEKFTVLEAVYGFITYKFQGDACIINDIYTKKEYRKTKAAWRLFDMLREKTTNNPNCNVLIGFSEFGGKNHQDGKGAMKAAGFIKIGQDNIREIYMRGNW